MADLTAKELLQQEIHLMSMGVAARRQALHYIEKAEQGSTDINPLTEDSPRSVERQVINIHDHRFANMRLREAMHNVLHQIGSCSFEELEGRLRSGGANLGKDPSRYSRVVKITVTANPGDFRVTPAGKVELKQRPKHKAA